MICSCRQRSSRRRRSAGQSRCGGARGEAGRGRARTRIQSPSCTSTRQRCTSTPTATTACHGQMSRARRLSARGGHQARSSRTVEPALLDAPSRSAQTAPRHLDTAPTHRRSARRGGRKRPPHGLIRGCGENELTGRTGCPPLSKFALTIVPYVWHYIGARGEGWVSMSFLILPPTYHHLFSSVIISLFYLSFVLFYQHGITPHHRSSNT